MEYLRQFINNANGAKLLVQNLMQSTKNLITETNKQLFDTVGRVSINARKIFKGFLVLEKHNEINDKAMVYVGNFTSLKMFYKSNIQNILEIKKMCFNVVDEYDESLNSKNQIFISKQNTSGEKTSDEQLSSLQIMKLMNKLMSDNAWRDRLPAQNAN